MFSEKPLSTDFVPLVSVVIPTRNRYDLLRRALDSVLSQSYSEVEVIVIDDNSDDLTPEIEIDYNTKFRKFKYLRNQINVGGAESRNIGINNSTGKYIAFLDDDDEWLPDKTIKQVLSLERDLGIGAISCWYYRVDHRGAVRKTQLVPEVTFRTMLWENFMGSFSLCMVRSEIARKIMLDPLLRSAQDWQFWLEASKAARLGIVQDYMVNYYDHSGERISSSYGSRLAGIRRVFLRYRNDMTRGCREYWATYLMVLKSLNAGLKLNKRFTMKCFNALMNPVSRFALKKMLLLKAVNFFRVGGYYDATAATYKYITGNSKHIL